LEPLVQLAPFAKRPLQITLRGITNDETDIGVRAHPHRRLHAHVQERERESEKLGSPYAHSLTHTVTHSHTHRPVQETVCVCVWMVLV
jgi:hypothetical protein